MWKLFDQLLFIPLSVLVVLFGIAWLVAHPSALVFTILALAIIFVILWIREKRNPISMQEKASPKLPVKRRGEITEADFWKWFNGQNKR